MKNLKHSVPRSTKLEVNFVKLSYQTGTRFNPQEKLTHYGEDKNNMDNIDRGGVFAEDTIVNVQDDEPGAQTLQSETKQRKIMKSFMRWKTYAEKKMKDKDCELTDRQER